MELEVRAIGERLHDGARVLDVGCANGWSTVQLAAARDIFIRGVDYVPAMIDAARARLDQLQPRLHGTVEFDVGDVLALDVVDGTYDAVVCSRVIINLGDWERQSRGLAECVRVLRPDGMFLLSEATLQGWGRLNALRTEWGLAEIGMPAFNTYLDEERVVAELADRCELVELVNFASTYYVGSRVLKPLLAQA
ncbi:MAG TPA: class I SAM-dependent methyltransferase, partial [Gaiellaceae bacterium]|nr:class I SAM-dependent methyltransferase [Gaiellaceae bacterium]